MESRGKTEERYQDLRSSTGSKRLSWQRRILHTETAETSSFLSEKRYSRYLRYKNRAFFLFFRDKKFNLMAISLSQAIVFAGLVAVCLMISGIISFIRYFARNHNYKLVSLRQKSTRLGLFFLN